MNAKEFKETFEKLANDGEVGEKYKYYTSDDKECAAQYGADSLPAMVLHRKFDESPLTSTNFALDSAKQWLKSSSVPVLIEFGDDYIEPIFGERKSAVFLFRANDDNDKSFQKVFAEAASKYNGEIIFAYSDVTGGIQSRLGEFVGVTSDMLPCIRILDPTKDMAKYAFEGDLNTLSVDAIGSFVQDFKDNKLSPFMKSDPIPEQTEAYTILVGKNFNEIAMDPTKDVLVKFYAPWCGHCKTLAPIWDDLAKELKDVPDLVIAKFDATTNEAEGVSIRGYPTIKFYPKDNKVKDFEGDREFDDFKNYLKDNSSAYKAYLEQKGDL